MWKFVAVILVLRFSCTVVHGLQCHICNTASEEDCGVAYKASAAQAVNCGLTENVNDSNTVCYTFYLSALGHVMIDRGCSTSGNSTCSELEAQLISSGWRLDDVSRFCETCSKNACNAIQLQDKPDKSAGTKTLSSVSIVLITILLAATIRVNYSKK